MVNLQSFVGKRVIYVGHDSIAQGLQAFLTQYASIENFIIIGQVSVDETVRDEDIIIKSPSIPGHSMNHVYTTPARIFFDCAQQTQATVVGVTGTKGKTCVTSLIHEILMSNSTAHILINDVSEPMFMHAHELSETSIVIMELSSMDLAELEISPNIAVITNLGRNHIDYHGSIDAYWEAKHNIVRFSDENTKVVFNPNTEMVYHWLADKKAQQVPIDTNEMVDLSKSQLFGDNARHNFLMARAVTSLLGVEKFVANGALATFTPARHRQQIVREHNGVTYVDNSIVAEPEDTVADIEACIRQLKPVGSILLGGGESESSDFSSLAKIISTLRIPTLVLFPGIADKIKTLFPETYTPEILETESMDEAVKWASQHTPSGSTCLLSSATPSEPTWENYEEKGNQFQAAVQKL